MERWLAGDGLPLAEVAASVRAWTPFAADSPLYELFAQRLADDPDILAVLARIRTSPPINVLFAAVQHLLTADDALAAWYPRLAGESRTPDDAAYAAFRAFVLSRRDEILELAATRRTQTNEVRRCAVLMPVIAAALAERGWDGPVHAIDMGASAGLGLLMDSVAYRYGDTRIGSSPLTLDSENRGGFALPDAPPAFATRTGLDLAPVDATDPAQAAWLEALVWPEQADRLERLRAAIALRRDVDITMVAGDAALTLPQVASALPTGPIVLWHSIALYQLPDEALDAIDEAVARVAAERPLVRVAFEPQPGGGADIRVALRPREAAPVATAHTHGAWLDLP
ncbi:DUF2332 domain-containing protein [Demequina rhizosphaerae]|uniref:DUF2332 domain-containing protein n=1 Tax=Demequina rhizosphaerae TaxID=1638985 RepID=UPI000784D1FD|nr:DUF2332 domain-containing protein [Demequina rhizosphaerae]